MQAGGELSYNLFLLNEDCQVMEDHKKFSLAVTFHKRKIVRAGRKAKWIPENGG
ncbi:hypothetical protein [Pallidibacillus pasinlerensis]|uniref:Uncharacterized protein n=1 Tax=Pallidibacillus pasinlerensis TaxID=2703818 RepID=A0ABW9ZYZ3_9BACI|nr:hypothetical protein [Pallidibacillus pasinlerensis]NCU16385.1 hypothetical protein [Pallidibacillus pasinlerensis]